jgi:hypothetical protein
MRKRKREMNKGIERERESLKKKTCAFIYGASLHLGKHM